jgi:flagellar basal body-associated protein FliL
MFTRNKKNAENKTNNKPLLILLFMAIFLFLIWLIMVFFLSFFYDAKKIKGNIFEENSHVLTSLKSEKKKIFNFTNPQDKIDDSITNEIMSQNSRISR